jgi:fluoride exporter
MLENILALSIGAIFGALARYAITHVSSELTQHAGFPFGTLAVNVIGCFAVGWILTWTAGQANDRWRLLAATGFCGAFTTFSAFAYESMVYWRQGQIATFGVNVIANNVLCFLALAFGIALRNGQVK